MALTAGKPMSGECGDVAVVVLTDEHGWVGEVRAEVVPLILAAEVMRDALKKIEAHHVALNKKAFRDEARSKTLGFVRAALPAKTEYK